MKYDLEDRLINFASSVLELTELLPARSACVHLGHQLTRSGTAPALIYGEAQGAESRNDFIHKMKVGLKELRETSVCLRIIERQAYIQPVDKLHFVLRENIELIAIFVKSIKTAASNNLRS
jgi:four helix bundle protein